MEMIEITDKPLDTTANLAAVHSRAAGAEVLFVGVTREVAGDRRTSSLEYECYPAMAKTKLQELADEARRRWPLEGCAIVHRIGHLEPGEASVAIAISS